MPMTARFQVFFFANAPSKTMSIPKDVSILGHVLEDGSFWCPFNSLRSHLVSTITIGIGSSQNVKGVTNDVRDSIFISLEVD